MTTLFSVMDVSVDGPQGQEDPREKALQRARRLATSLAELGELEAVERAAECEVLAASVRSLIGELAALRRAALREARDSGMTLTQIAADLGVSVQAISKAIKNDPGSGRARPKEDDG